MQTKCAVFVSVTYQLGEDELDNYLYFNEQCMKKQTGIVFFGYSVFQKCDQLPNYQ